jgi:hypothetical protein
MEKETEPEPLALVAVELPLLVREGAEEKALGMVGGLQEVLRLARSERDVALRLMLSKDNPLAKPVSSQACQLPENRLLVRIRRKGGKLVAAEQVGKVQASFDWNWRNGVLADFQMIDRDKCNPESEEVIPRLVPDTLLPHEFLTPFAPSRAFKYVATKRKQVTRQRATGRVAGLRAQVIQYHEKMPTITPEIQDAIERIKSCQVVEGDLEYDGEEEDDDEQDQDFDADVAMKKKRKRKKKLEKRKMDFDLRAQRRREALEYLEQEFAKHPLRFRKDLEGSANQTLRYLVVGTLPCVAYHISNGPWRNYWVRYGYTPMVRPESRFFQSLDFRLKGEELKQIRIRAGQRDVKIFGFHTLAAQNYLPFYSVLLRCVQDIILEAPILCKPTRDGGWFQTSMVKRIRTMMCVYINSLYTHNFDPEGESCGGVALSQDEFLQKALGGRSLTDMESDPPVVGAEPSLEGDSDGEDDDEGKGAADDENDDDDDHSANGGDEDEDGDSNDDENGMQPASASAREILKHLSSASSHPKKQSEV